MPTAYMHAYRLHTRTMTPIRTSDGMQDCRAGSVPMTCHGLTAAIRAKPDCLRILRYIRLKQKASREREGELAAGRGARGGGEGRHDDQLHSFQRRDGDGRGRGVTDSINGTCLDPRICRRRRRQSSCELVDDERRSDLQAWRA